MVATRKHEQHEISALARVEIKASGIVLWRIESESGHVYRVVLGHNGCPSPCEREDGEPCPAWHYRQACHHTELALERENACRSTREKRAEPQADRRQHGALNYNKPFSLLN